MRTTLGALVVATLLVGCKVERIVPRGGFACTSGGPCDFVDAGTSFSDASFVAPDSGVARRDASPVDASSSAMDASTVDGSNAVPDGGGMDGGGPPDSGGVPCDVAADCLGAGEICFGGTCKVRCNLAGGLDCAALGGTCNQTTGRCLATLELGVTCAIDDDCASDFCLSYSRSGVSMRECTDPCSSAGKCPLGFSCAPISGMSFCLKGPDFTTPAGGFCEQGSIACQSGWCQTQTRTCIESCSKPSDCVNIPGMNCLTFVQTGSSAIASLCATAGVGTNAAGVACSSNGQCRSGICDRDSSTCAQHCCSDPDCGGVGGTCQQYAFTPTFPIKVCRTRGMGTGAGVLGDACQSSTECESGICNPVDPSMPNGARKCSTTCCDNMDCTGALPMGGTCRTFASTVIGGAIVGQCLPN